MPHIHDKIDFTVEVFVVCRGKVLLRRHDKYGMWLSVGGHIELDEDPNQAAVREVKEEVGLDIELAGTKRDFRGAEGYRELVPPAFLNRHHLPGTAHEHVSLVYFATSKTSTVTPERPQDVWGWFSREEIEGREDLTLHDNVRQYALEALKELA